MVWIAWRARKGGRIVKKVLLIIILAFSIVLVACSNGNDVDKFDIAIVTDNEELGNDAKSQMIESGLLKIGDRVSISKNGSTSEDRFIRQINNYINRDYDLIIATNFEMNEAIRSLADQNKETKFLVFNSIIDPSLENVNSLLFKTNESSFLAGYLAGLVTKTNIIGYIGSNSGVLSDFYEYGFKAGLLYAARELKTEMAVKTQYIEDLSDYSKGKELADAMYNDGVDVIYQTAGYAGVGAIESAKNNNKYIIGYDEDQSYLAPENVLTSTIKNYEFISEDLGMNYLTNSIESGQKLIYGIKEDGVSITKFNETSIYSIENYNKVMSLYEKIKAGEIVVPFDGNSFKKFMEN